MQGDGSVASTEATEPSPCSAYDCTWHYGF